VRVVVDGGTAPPAAPGALTANAQGGQVSLTWSPPSDGGLPDEYVIEAGLDSNNLTPVARTARPALVAAGVPPGTYSVRVRAVNAAGAGPAGAIAVVVVP